MSKEENKKIKYKIHDEDKNTLFEKTDTQLWLFANYVVIFFILLSIVLVWLDTMPNIRENYSLYIFITDFVISWVFLIEYFYRWYHSSKKKTFPFKILNIFDFLSFFPFFVLAFTYWAWSSIFAIFRVFRLFRIFELIEKIPIAMKILRWINKHKVEYLAVVFMIFIVVTIFSTIVYYVEFHYWDPEVFSSLPITMWWGIVTMTTVWYWDMIPITALWKTISIFLMFFWPILVTILSSITVIIFIDSTQIWKFNKKDIRCVTCFEKNDNDSRYCKKCWKSVLHPH